MCIYMVIKISMKHLYKFRYIFHFMRPKAKRLMGPLNRAVWSSLVNSNCSNHSNCNSSCTSGSEHEIGSHILIGVDDEDESLQELSSSSEDDNEDDGCGKNSSKIQEEPCPLPFLRQQLAKILQGSTLPFVSRLLSETEKARISALRSCAKITHPEEKWSKVRRLVMNTLRFAGYNAAICKTKWQQSHAYPAGSYEFIDVVVDASRYFVDLDFRAEFEIARGTSEYQTLLNDLPVIYVGGAERLQKIIKFMSDCARTSLKRKDLLFPPWRKYRYMQFKWFGQYRRTINPNPNHNMNISSSSSSSASGNKNAKVTSALASAFKTHTNK